MKRILRSPPPAQPAFAEVDDRAADFDSPWKEAIGAYFQPFMALFFLAVHDRIDWARPHEFLDAELQQITGDADLGRRYADRLVKVYSVEGAEVWLLIHIEVQGRADEQFPARMFQYYYRIYDRYGDVEILSLAVVTNQTLDPERAPDAYQRERDGYGLRFRFRVQALRDWSEATLVDLAATNPFAVVALAQLAAHRRSKEVKRKIRKREIIALLYRYGYGREDVLQLLRFIDWLIRLPKGLELELRNELIALEEETKMAYVMSIERLALEKGREEGMEKGVEKGMEKGREETLCELLVELLVTRFGPLPETVREQLAVADAAQLSIWFRRALTAATMDAVFADV